MQWQPGGPSRSEITSNFYPVSLSDVTPHDVSLRHVGLVLKLPKLSISFGFSTEFTVSDVKLGLRSSKLYRRKQRQQPDAK